MLATTAAALVTHCGPAIWDATRVVLVGASANCIDEGAASGDAVTVGLSVRISATDAVVTVAFCSRLAVTVLRLGEAEQAGSV